MNSQAEFDFNAPPPPPARPKVSAERLAEIAEKIKKLLRLAKSANAAEAALALQRAFELANRHGIDTASLDLDDEREKMTHEFFAFRSGFLQKRLLGIVMTYFRVDPCMSGNRVAFIGRQSDVQIAGYIYEFLVRVSAAELSKFSAEEKRCRRKVTTNKTRSWSAGFTYAICRKLDAARLQIVLDDSKTALVIAEEAARKAHLRELFPNTEEKTDATKFRRHETALEAGHRTGRNTTIAQPLGNAAGGPLMLA